METPLLDCQLALSKTVEKLQNLSPGSIPIETASLFGLYLAQAGEALAKAAAK